MYLRGTWGDGVGKLSDWQVQEIKGQALSYGHEQFCWVGGDGGPVPCP